MARKRSSASTNGAGGASLDSLTKGLANTQREKIAATDKVASGIEGQLGADQARVQKAFKDEGFSPNDLKPWNEEQESAKRRTDPIAAFGSFGSVFGILASAFTHAPMENALNASAAAMTAIKDGDALGYERAKDAWEKNNKLALDRHKIQHEAYQDAATLMQTNLGAGEAKMRMLASKFGDQKTLMLLDAGLSEDAMKLMESRDKLATSLNKNRNSMLLENTKMQDLISDPRYKEPAGSPGKAQLINEWNSRWNGKSMAQPEAEAYASYIKAHPDATPEERADYIHTLRMRKEMTPEQTAINAYIDQNPDASADDIKKFVVELKAGGKGSQRQPKPEEAEIVRRRDEKVKAGMEPAQAYAEAVQEVKRSGAVPTANRMDELDSKISRIDYMKSTIDKTVDLLKKHKAITGLGGTVTRPMEAIGNVFGSNETDRKQFERYIAELQEWAPRVLTDSNGRPLSAEAGKIASIIAGLKIGDTSANTARAYAELVPLLDRIQGDLKKRRGGPTSSAAPATEEKTKPKPSWMSAPEVSP